MGRFEVTLHGGEVVSVDEADAYQPEGPLTTFFCRGSSRATIDSWSVRVASFRTADIVAIRRAPAALAGVPGERPAHLRVLAS
ncbi:MAG: hypothetical protein R2755_10820 [Acidimicrobiales bacterium]